MTLMIVAGVLGTAALIAGCASEPAPETVQSASGALIDGEISVEVDGCSNAEIRQCVSACEGTVNYCNKDTLPGHGAVWCYCKGGDVRYFYPSLLD
jgi:hypothetical protein